MEPALVAALSLGLRLSAGDKDAWIVPEEAKKLKNPIPVTEAGLSAARDLYKDKCVKCHSETGKGDGVEAAMYSVKAADFTDASMMKQKTDGELFYKLSQGRRPMPSFKKQLADEQRWQLVNFLRTLAAPSANPDKK
ncbi:MAG TPA: cytochrome c [Candidatus Dormibacteraeota bacterium]|nr:cytochrome c [Candidatus Dormibacteraeota bacterium]